MSKRTPALVVVALLCFTGSCFIMTAQNKQTPTFQPEMKDPDHYVGEVPFGMDCDWNVVSAPDPDELLNRMRANQHIWLNYCEEPFRYGRLSTDVGDYCIPQQMFHPVTGEPVGADLTKFKSYVGPCN